MLQLLRDMRRILAQSRTVMISVVIAFIFPAIFGYLLPAAVKNVLFQNLIQTFADIGGVNVGFGLFLPIFFNNALASFLILSAGVILIGSLALVVFNGFSVGILLDLILRASVVSGASVAGIVVGLLPHGVLELPAILLAAVYGTLFGLKLYFGKKVLPQETRSSFVRHTMRVYLLIILPLLLVAALIEATITPRLVSFFVAQEAERHTSEPSLNNKVLTADDIRGLGLQFREVIPSAGTEVSLAEGWSQVGALATLFDDEIYREYKKIKNRPMIRRSFTDGNQGLAIQIISFSTSTEAATALKFTRQFLTDSLTSAQEPFTAEVDTTIGATSMTTQSYLLYTIGPGTAPTSWLAYGSTGPYLLILKLTGGTAEVFRQIVALQFARLK